jgi:REP element-mobilizing transposase RayT
MGIISILHSAKEGVIMPRCARIKSSDSIYHIMVRSISDVDLFCTNQDKDKYLSLIKKYQVLFAFKVYAYCIMNTHAHLIIDSAGADISRIMHAINQSYAQYYNKGAVRKFLFMMKVIPGRTRKSKMITATSLTEEEKQDPGSAQDKCSWNTQR